MPAVGQDAWYRPTTPTNLTEPRWVRAIEIRPSSVKGRKITHHALAFLRQSEAEHKEFASAAPAVQGDGLFMEWAVGKHGDEMRPNSGRLMLPGSSITWEMHYHAVGEEITSHTELAVWFYPEGPGAEASRGARPLQHLLGAAGRHRRQRPAARHSRPTRS